MKDFRCRKCKKHISQDEVCTCNRSHEWHYKNFKMEWLDEALEEIKKREETKNKDNV